MFVFQKSDLLSSNRKLRHEGELLWKSARGKLTEIHAVLLTDVLIFLQENNQKFTFASQDNKVRNSADFKSNTQWLRLVIERQCDPVSMLKF